MLIGRLYQNPVLSFTPGRRVNMGGMIEPLEPRRLCATVQAVNLLGTETQITGVILTFNGLLDPVTAQNPKAYFIGRTKTVGGDSWFNPFGLLDQPHDDTVRVRVATAVYEPALNRVTLTPAVPFNVAEKFRRVRVSGKGAHAVMDATGVPIDGNYDGKPGKDAVLHMHLVKAKNFEFNDPDGDHAKLHLTGPGRLWGVRSKQGGFPPLVFLHQTNGLKSGLTGKVKRHKKTGDGLVTIGQISGTTFASAPILTDPAFHVNVVSP
jgi:hypothetical protein